MVEAKLQVKRVYDRTSDDDGYRVLVDRVWRRGLRKVDTRLDEWQRVIAPSSKLRDKPEPVRCLYDRAQAQTLTLLFGA